MKINFCLRGEKTTEDEVEFGDADKKKYPKCLQKLNSRSDHDSDEVEMAERGKNKFPKFLPKLSFWGAGAKLLCLTTITVGSLVRSNRYMSF